MNLLTLSSSTSVILTLALTLTPICSGRRVLIPETPIHITAVALASAYDKDEAAANKKYKDRVLAVTGMVSSISFKENSNGDRYMLVSLRSLAEPQKEKEVPYLGDVTCMFKNPRKSSIAKLKKGQEVMIQGTCKGMTMFFVVLDDCTLVSSGKSLA